MPVQQPEWVAGSTGWGCGFLFLRGEHEWLDGGSGAQGAAVPALRLRRPAWVETLTDRFPDFDPFPDLGSRIGSGEWYRGAATCAGMLALAWLLSPGFERPILGRAPAPLTGDALDQARSQGVTALALGANSGTRMGATAAARPLNDTPERPVIDVSGTMSGSFERFLTRSGMADDEAARVAAMVGDAVPLDAIRPGTRIAMKLGRRPEKDAARPLEMLAFRARFDLAIDVKRTDGGALALKRIPIAIDNTPLRIRARVGGSLYRAARAAGAPARAVEAYIRAMRLRLPMSRIGANDQFDLIVERQRAETGEERLGKLLYAAIDQGNRQIQLVRWEQGGRTEWFDAKGVGENRGEMARPVPGAVSSGFGARFHPVLRYRRQHNGLDFKASYGTPIRAASSGVVAYAGWHGGHGKFVKVNHAGSLATGYAHMSRIAVSSGTRVSAGQVIGYVGSTGLSTGPHLHYEVYRGGRPVNPANFKFTVQQQLSGGELRQFRAMLARLMAVPAANGGRAK
nr:M23 family metallopeptidase [Sphingomonas sp. BGYR3]